MEFRGHGWFSRRNNNFRSFSGSRRDNPEACHESSGVRHHHSFWSFSRVYTLCANEMVNIRCAAVRGLRVLDGSACFDRLDLPC